MVRPAAEPAVVDEYMVPSDQIGVVREGVDLVYLDAADDGGIGGNAVETDV